MSGRWGQGGAALVVSLLLLVILTLLSVTGMRMSIAELVMAGNEQFHQKASAAASAGVEVAISEVLARDEGVIASVEVIGPRAVGVPATDSFTATIVHTGREAMVPGSSAEKFVAEDHEIASVGTSARNARDEQVQGIAIISAAGGVRSFRRAGAGLASGGAGAAAT